MRPQRSAAAILIPATVVGVLALGACTGNSNGSDGKPGSGRGTLTYGASEGVSNWNRNIAAGATAGVQDALVRVQLHPFTVNAKFQIVPDADFNAPGTTPHITKNNPFTIEYQINPKAVWSDGMPVTAVDFKFDWQVNNPTGTYAACQTIDGNMDKIRSVTGSGPANKTVTVVYKMPFPDWTMQLYALPSHLMNKATPEATCAAYNKGFPGDAPPPAGSSDGPWVISTVNTTQQNFTESPNPKWWGHKPGLSRIIYNVTSDASDKQVLQNGEAGLIYPSPQLGLVKAIKSLPNIAQQVSFGLSFEHIDFNTTNKFLKDATLRKAIAMTLDREAITKSTVGQFSDKAQVVNNRILVNNEPGYHDNAPPQYNKPDPQGASAMLKAAGYTKSGGVLKTPQGVQVELGITTATNDQLQAQTEVLVQSQLGTIGIKVTPKQLSSDVLYGGPTVQGSFAAGDFDMALFYWTASPLLTDFQSLYACVPGNNRTVEKENYTLGCDKRADGLMNKAVLTIPLSKQWALWNDVDKQLWNDMFTLPLYQKPTFIAYDKKYHGITGNASAIGPLWNSDTWVEK